MVIYLDYSLKIELKLMSNEYLHFSCSKNCSCVIAVYNYSISICTPLHCWYEYMSSDRWHKLYIRADWTPFSHAWMPVYLPSCNITPNIGDVDERIVDWQYFPFHAWLDAYVAPTSRKG